MRTPLLERLAVPPALSVESSSPLRVAPPKARPARLASALVLAAMVSAQLSWVTPARADDTAKAKAMFTEGLGLEQSKDFAGALAKFEAVAKVKKTPQVTFHVAYCLERVGGRMLDALALYKETLAEATAGASDPKLAQVKTTTEEAIAALEKKIPTVTVTSKGPKPSGAEITLDGKKLAALDKPEKVEPGVHVVEAKAEGKEPFTAKVDAPEETQRTVEIRWKDTKGAADADEEPEPVKKAPPPPPPVQATSSSKLPFVVGGVGVASLIASGVFFGIRTSAQGELEDKCQGTLCPESVRSTGDRGKMATTVSNVTLIVGLVGLGAGITLYAIDSKKAPAAASLAPKPTRLRAGVSAVPGAGFATFSGAFLASSQVLSSWRHRLVPSAVRAVPLPEVPHALPPRRSVSPRPLRRLLVPGLPVRRQALQRAERRLGRGRERRGGQGRLFGQRRLLHEGRRRG